MIERLLRWLARSRPRSPRSGSRLLLAGEGIYLDRDGVPRSAYQERAVLHLCPQGCLFAGARGLPVGPPDPREARFGNCAPLTPRVGV